MINSAKLKSKIVEKELTIEKLAKKIGIGNYTLGQKISNNKSMTVDEARKIIEILEIESQDVENIFFA